MMRISKGVGCQNSNPTVREGAQPVRLVTAAEGL